MKMMANDDRSLKFTIPQKNNSSSIVTSNNLAPISIPFKFSRYGFNINSESLTLGEIEKEGKMFLPGIRIDKARLLSRSFDKDGYVYVYYEEKTYRDEFDYEYGAEYKLSTVSNDDKNYAEVYYKKYSALQNEELGDKLPHINFEEGDIVWVAFSQVRWCDQFRDKIMNDFDSVKKRFVKLDVDKFVEQCREGCTLDDFNFNWLKSTLSYSKWTDENIQVKKEEEITLASVKKFDTLYIYERQYGESNYILTLPCISLFAKDICDLIEKRTEDFKTYINMISSGIDPANPTSTLVNQSEYQKLFASASLLYKIITDLKAKNVNKPYDIVQFEKFEVLLDFNKRIEKKNKIKTLRTYVMSIIKSSGFKYEMLEYIDNKPQRTLEGQKLLLELYVLADQDPNILDAHIYSRDLYQETLAQAYMLNQHENINQEVDFKLFVLQNRFHVGDWMKKKYDELDIDVLKYEDIDIGTYNMLLLLSNIIISEENLLNERPLNTTIADIYNVASYATADENLDKVIPYDIAEAGSLIIKTTAYVEQSFWYFSNFYLSSQQYKSLLSEIDRIETVIEEYNISIGEIEKVEIPKRMADLDLESFEQKIRATDNNELVKEYEKIRKEKQNLKKTNRKGKTNQNRIKLERAITRSTIHSSTKKSKISDIASETRNRKMAEMNIYGRKIQDIQEEIGVHHSMKNQATYEMTQMEENTYKKVSKIHRSPYLTYFMMGITLANTYSNWKRVMNDFDVNAKNSSDVVVDIVDLLNSGTSFLAFVASVKKFNNGQYLLDKFGWANKSMALATRLTIVASIFQIISDTIKTVNRVNRNNPEAALAYSVSATTLGVATYILYSMSVATGTVGSVTAPAMPWVAGALLAVSFASSMIASHLDYTEFEEFLAATVFYKGWWSLVSSNTLNAATYNTSYKMGYQLYKDRDKMASDSYTGLGFENINLRSMHNMYDVVISLFTTIDFSLTCNGHKLVAYQRSWVKYTTFKLNLRYWGGIFSKDTLEYEARLYPNCYTLDHESECKKIELIAKPDKDTGKWCTSFEVDPTDLYGLGTSNRSRNAYLLVLVRIKSLELSADGKLTNEYYPSLRDNKNVYFGIKIPLISELGIGNNLCYSAKLQPGTIDELLKNK